MALALLRFGVFQRAKLGGLARVSKLAGATRIGADCVRGGGAGVREN